MVQSEKGLRVESGVSVPAADPCHATALLSFGATIPDPFRLDNAPVALAGCAMMQSDIFRRRLVENASRPSPSGAA
jgi:hypothetical protein